MNVVTLCVYTILILQHNHCGKVNWRASYFNMHPDQMLLLVLTICGACVCVTLSFDIEQFTSLSACVNVTQVIDPEHSGSGDGSLTPEAYNECECPDGRKGMKCRLKVQPFGLYYRNVLQANNEQKVYLIFTATHCGGEAEKKRSSTITIKGLPIFFPFDEKYLDFGTACWISLKHQLILQKGNKPAKEDPMWENQGIQLGMNWLQAIVLYDVECK